MNVRRVTSRFALASQFIASMLVAMSALRFGVAGFQEALSATEPNVPDRPVPHNRGGRTPAPKPSGEDGTPTKAPAKGGAQGPSIRVTLAVTAGPPRSEVFVNGRRVGHSPFLGDLSCKRGREVKIEIIPTKGPLIRAVKTCRPGTINVEGKL